eukprot:355623-Chlamydomonas_euryale.AAC.17
MGGHTAWGLGAALTAALLAEHMEGLLMESLPVTELFAEQLAGRLAGPVPRFWQGIVAWAAQRHAGLLAERHAPRLTAWASRTQRAATVATTAAAIAAAAVVATLLHVAAHWLHMVVVALLLWHHLLDGVGVVVDDDAAVALVLVQVGAAREQVVEPCGLPPMQCRVVRGMLRGERCGAAAGTLRCCGRCRRHACRQRLPPHATRQRLRRRARRVGRSRVRWRKRRQRRGGVWLCRLLRGRRAGALAGRERHDAMGGQQAARRLDERAVGVRVGRAHRARVAVALYPRVLHHLRNREAPRGVLVEARGDEVLCRVRHAARHRGE